MSDFMDTGKQIDYTFMKEMVDNLTVTLFEPAKDPDEFVMDVFSGSGTTHANAQGEINPNLFMSSPNGNQGQFANTPEKVAHVRDNIDELNRRLEGLKGNEVLSDKPGVQQYYGFQQELLTDAKNGIDVWKYLTRIPGGEKSLGHADFKATQKVYPDDPAKGAAEYEQMFQEMGYTKVWDNLTERIHMENDMDGKLLSNEQKKEYSQRIQKSNAEMIDVYQGMMTADNERKFGHLYHDFGSANHGTVSGSRGYHSTVTELVEENTALANGWDVTRIADYRMMKSFSEKCVKSDEMFEEFSDPALGNYAKLTKKVAVLNPEGKKFDSQDAFDRYMMEYQQAITDLGAEAKKPEVKQAIQSGIETYSNKVKADDSISRKDKNTVITRMEDMLPAALSIGKVGISNQTAYLNKATDLAALNLTGDPAALEAREERIRKIKSSLLSERELQSVHENKVSDYFKENPNAAGRPGPNENGKEHIWDAMGGRINKGRMINKVSLESDEFWSLAREKKGENIASFDEHYTKFHKVDEDGVLEDDFLATAVEGDPIGGDNKGVYIGGDKFTKVVAEGHEKDAQNYINEAVNVIHDGARIIRGMKSDDPDRNVARTIDRSANRIAKWADDYAEIVKDEKGSLALGEARSATLTQTLVKAGALPILSRSTELKKCKNQAERIEHMHSTMDKSIRIMHQFDKPEGERVSIFDDFMDIMDGANSELKTEFHRQHMEQTGWDANKDAIYKTELKASHEKVIASFEKLCKVQNVDEYREALNNDLFEITGNKKARDMSSEVGYMKGENRAIDLGYPSDQLFAFGELGAIEGQIERDIRRQDTEMRSAATPEVKARIETEKKRLNSALAELTEIKNEVWGKEYTSPEDTLAIYHKQNKFLNEHPEFAHNHLGDSFREARELNSLADKTADIKALSEAMNTFNAKRTDKWLSSESKPHRILRESAEALQREVKAYKTGVYQEGDRKGQKMSEEERIALREAIERRADEVSRNSETYLGKRKGERSTEAGNQRKAGAESLKSLAASIRESIRIDREKELEASQKFVSEKEERAAGVDESFGEDISDAMDLAESERVRRNKADDAAKEQKKNPRRSSMDQLYSQLQAEAKLEFHESATTKGGLSDNFTHLVACMVTGTAMQIQAKREGRAISDRNLSSMAGRLENDPAFKEMMKGVEGNVKKQQEIAAMEPGEIYAKYAMVRQNMKMREAQAGQKQRAASINAAQQQMQQQGPKK